MPTTVTSTTRLTPKLKYLITIGCALAAANLYYCQPLLGAFSRAFDITEEAASFINICSQLGYGLGLFFIVPLGDMFSRRKMLILLHILAALSLVGMCFATDVYGLYFFSVCIGVTSTACQIFIPLAADLSTDEERGSVLGLVMGGLLTGILLSRTLSGFMAEYFGWKSVYVLGAGLMLLMGFLVWKIIPSENPSFSGNYKKLMKSLLNLFRQQSVIRESAWIGACLFGALSVFWSTMAFFLEGEPYSYSLAVIGLFGIIGTGGALVSPYIGKVTDKSGPFKPMRWGIVLMIIGWMVLFEGRWSIWMIILGIILIDVGMQSAHIPNLARNYALLPEARTRLNTLYMTSFFIGGTLGSSIGSVAWNLGEWTGVCIAGFALAALGAIPVFLRRKRVAG